jgi:hypothetical protein
VTRAPAFARKYAMEQPMTPPPTMTTSLTTVLLLFKRRIFCVQ